MQQQSVLFKLLICFIFFTFIKINSYSQTGLNFQGVARSSNNVIIASQQISLRLSILQGSATGNVEYTETRKVTTNAQGLFAVVIGDADATNTLGNFTTINWKNTPKYLKIEMDASAGNNYTTIGTTQFQYVAYAQFASSVDAENIIGVVPVAKGGTGVSTSSALKTSLFLDKINNTSDVDKPISAKTQTALDLKLNAADTSRYVKQNFVDSALTTKFKLIDTIKYTKLAYTDSSLVTKLKLLDTASMLSNRIGKDTLNLSARIDKKANTVDVTAGLALKANNSDLAASLVDKFNKTDTAYLLQKKDTITLSNRIDLKANTIDVTVSLANKVDKVAGKVLSTNDYTTAEKTKLAGISGTNTGDQDLSAYATNTALALKANTVDVTAGLALKANNSDITTSLSTKVDKVTGKELSTNDYTTAEKTKLAAISGTNTGDETDASIKSKLGVSSFFSGDYIDLSNKPDLTLKENTNNKSTNFNADSASDIKFPSVKAVKKFIDSSNANLLNGVVNLTTDQSIDGQKVFQNNLVMGNIGGDAGTISPTTINFANGSKIGDIQNINDGIPDVGSIDLYAPDGAKWVQLNYGNSTYIALDHSGAYIDLGEFSWSFLENGVTELPGDMIFKNNIVSNISSDNLLNISSSDVVRIRHDSENSYTRFGFYEDEAGLLIEHFDDLSNEWKSNEWNYKVDGTSWFPGDLNFIDDHSINFINTGTSTTSSSIYASGPSMYLNTRLATPTELEDEVDIGLELSYGNKNEIILSESGVHLSVNPNFNLNYLTQSNLSLNNSMIQFGLAGYGNYEQKQWTFNGEDGSTNLPGDLNLEGSIKIRNIDFSNLPGNNGDVLTLEGDGSVYWSAIQSSSGINSINGITSGTQSFTVNLFSTDQSPSFISDPSTSTHTLNLPMASDNSVTAGLISKSDYDIFYGKQNSLSNPIIGTSSGSFTRASGLIPFFYDGENKITGSNNLVWDPSNSRLGIGNQTPNYPVHINQGGLDEFGFMISSPPPTRNSVGEIKAYGSSIGFESNVGGSPNSYRGSFQLDADGNMVFRTSQSDLYFDNFGNGTTYFRVGLEGSHYNGMILDNTGNLEVRRAITASSDISTTGSIKTGSIFHDFINNNDNFIPAAIITATGDMTTPGSISASNFITTSDVRLKKNIKTLENSLTIIQQLNPVSYEKKQSLVSNVYTIKENGFIAQDLQKILPALVNESEDMDKLLSVNYTAIIPILTKGIQEQQVIIEEQKKRLDALEKLVYDLIQKK